MNRTAALVIVAFAVGCENDSAIDVSRKILNETMILEVHPAPLNKPRVVSTSPSKALIDRTVRGEPWDDITFVVLKRNDATWIEVSGSKVDGFSARYLENGREYVSVGPPESIEQMISILTSYLAADDQWRSIIEWD